MGSFARTVPLALTIILVSLSLVVPLSARVMEDPPPSGEGTHDFGDAPPMYPVTLGQNGARHSVPRPQINVLTLGPTVDVEPNGQPSTLATGDGNPDEDGVDIPSFYVGRPVTIPVQASAPGLLDVWVDYASNGNWLDPPDHPFIAMPVAAGTNVLWANVPADAVLGITYARFRLRTAGALTPYGPANDGEVEDYAIRICEPPEPPTCCTHIMLVLDSSGSMSGNPLGQVVAAATTFINGVAMPPSWMGVITFSQQAGPLTPLTQARVALLAALPSAAITATNPAPAITAATNELTGNTDPDCEDVIILISDGAPDPPGNSGPAIFAADAAKIAGIRIVTIGFSTTPAGDVFLGTIASPGDYRRAPTPADLMKIMADLIYEICHETPEAPCLPPGGDEQGGADLGDAPDPTNHYQLPMTAHPGVGAQYPTVYDLNTGGVPGPKHNSPDADIFLGAAVSKESDADLMPDQDGLVNIYPPRNAPDRDWADDGLVTPIDLPQCLQSMFSYTITVVSGPYIRYANSWFDFNRDGDWADILQCVDPARGLVSVPEWSVQDQVLAFPPGTYVVQTPLFDSYHEGAPDADLWMRLNVSEQLAPGPPDGRGALSAFFYGETEDYLLKYDPLRGGYRPGVEQ